MLLAYLQCCHGNAQHFKLEGCGRKTGKSIKRINLKPCIMFNAQATSEDLIS